MKIRRHLHVLCIERGRGYFFEINLLLNMRNVTFFRYAQTLHHFNFFILKDTKKIKIFVSAAREDKLMNYIFGSKLNCVCAMGIY